MQSAKFLTGLELYRLGGNCGRKDFSRTDHPDVHLHNGCPGGPWVICYDEMEFNVDGHFLLPVLSVI